MNKQQEIDQQIVYKCLEVMFHTLLHRETSARCHDFVMNKVHDEVQKPTSRQLHTQIKVLIQDEMQNE